MDIDSANSPAFNGVANPPAIVQKAEERPEVRPPYAGLPPVVSSQPDRGPQALPQVRGRSLSEAFDGTRQQMGEYWNGPKGKSWFDWALGSNVRETAKKGEYWNASTYAGWFAGILSGVFAAKYLGGESKLRSGLVGLAVFAAVLQAVSGGIQGRYGVSTSDNQAASNPSVSRFQANAADVTGEGRSYYGGTTYHRTNNPGDEIPSSMRPPIRPGPRPGS